MAAAIPAASPVARGPMKTAWLRGNTAGRGLRWVRGGAVTRAAGKVFFTLGGTDYVCSGMAVRSAHEDVVLTAAHCVTGVAGQWVANWIFVPGYRDGAEPYGAYTARRFFVSPGWTGSLGKGGAPDERYDVAFVTVGRSLPASLPVAFGGQAAPAKAYVFGYPAQAPFTGLYPNFCAGPAGPAPAPAPAGSTRMPCAMTAGDSGGPWLAAFSPRTGTGTVIAVSTFKLSDDRRVLYGTVLGRAARALYLKACLSPDR